MWRDYSKSYIKNNRASSMQICAAALIATFFLSLLCTTAYNAWIYEVEKIILEEGDWQGRITTTMPEEDWRVIAHFANVEKYVVNQELSKENRTVIDIYFQNIRTIYKDMPLITAQLGLAAESAAYHTLLLSRYFIHDPQDADPPLLLGFYVGILLIVSFSLVLIIRHSFELSMYARIRQLGTLSSIGATPKQISTCLIQEAALCAAAPIILGSLLGIAVSFGMMQLANIFAADIAGRHEAIFQYHPAIFVVTLLIAAQTIIFSAWIPARKLSKMSPLQAMRGSDALQLEKIKKSRMLSLLFGVAGELAGNALKARKKALRISTLSLLLSFLGFSIMLCFTTLSSLSTQFTYFERYQDAWDVMVTVKDMAIEDFRWETEMREISGVRNMTIYQKAVGFTHIADSQQSDTLIALGGLEMIAGTPKKDGQFQVTAPIVIMDDESFLQYCSQSGITPRLDGIVVLNRIWDSRNSNFRYKEYIPLVKENNKTTVLYSINPDKKAVTIPILAYTSEAPVLKEEYDNYALVHFFPLSLWKGFSAQLGGTADDTYIRMFGNENPTLTELNDLEEQVAAILAPAYGVESENRIREKLLNDRMMTGMVMIFGACCVLLATIGIANVFSNTLGFLRQRKREFAQYMSIGLTPSQLWEIFGIEALVIAGKPLLIALLLTSVAVQFMINASYLAPSLFWKEAPIVPILVFAVAIAAFVALAYYKGGKRLLKSDLHEALRHDAIS